MPQRICSSSLKLCDDFVELFTYFSMVTYHTGLKTKTWIKWEEEAMRFQVLIELHPANAWFHHHIHVFQM